MIWDVGKEQKVWGSKIYEQFGLVSLFNGISNNPPLLFGDWREYYDVTVRHIGHYSIRMTHLCYLVTDVKRSKM